MTSYQQYPTPEGSFRKSMEPIEADLEAIQAFLSALQTEEDPFFYVERECPATATLVEKLSSKIQEAFARAMMIVDAELVPPPTREEVFIRFTVENRYSPELNMESFTDSAYSALSHRLVTTNPVHELQEFVRHVEKGMRVAQQADSSWER